MYAKTATPSRDAYVANGPKPVFIQTRDIPFDQVQGEDLYCALSKQIKTDKIMGIQRIGSLWRIYLQCQEDRIKLISSGLQFRNTVIPVYDINPYTKTNDELTRVTIKDIPLSVNDSMIKCELEKMKCEVKGEIIRQKLRVNGQLVNCLNGDRVCYIEPPSQPLPRTIKVANMFRARLFHAGQPEQVKNCSKCLEAGHHASQCRNEIKCKICNQSGHKSVSCQADPNQRLRNNEIKENSNALNVVRNAAARTSDELRKNHDHNNSEADESDRTGHASTSGNHRSDDVSVRSKISRQPDISHFLRPRSTTSSPRKNDRKGNEPNENGDEDTNTISSSDETCSEEEHISRSPTPKRGKKGMKRKRGKARK